MDAHSTPDPFEESMFAEVNLFLSDPTACDLEDFGLWATQDPADSPSRLLEPSPLNSDTQMLQAAESKRDDSAEPLIPDCLDTIGHDDQYTQASGYESNWNYESIPETIPSEPSYLPPCYYPLEGLDGYSQSGQLFPSPKRANFQDWSNSFNDPLHEYWGLGCSGYRCPGPHLPGRPSTSQRPKHHGTQFPQQLYSSFNSPLPYNTLEASGLYYTSHDSPQNIPITREEPVGSADMTGDESDSLGFTSEVGLVQHNRKLKRNKDPACYPSTCYSYKLPRDLDWRNPSDSLRFKYTKQGQWDKSVRLNAQGVRYYLGHCPRKVKVWLQSYPAQSKLRMDELDSKCRYTNCPQSKETILCGWFRVAFDEFPQQTTNGTKDPFKVAGSMHLWCFEQCVDSSELLHKKIMVSEIRPFPKEEKNPMAINRDQDRYIVTEAVRPWVSEQRAKTPSRIPRVHEDTLSYKLVTYRLSKQVPARQYTRDTRNEKKQEGVKKTLDVHKGDLSLAVQLERELRESRRRTKQLQARKATEDLDTFQDYEAMDNPYMSAITTGFATMGADDGFGLQAWEDLNNSMTDTGYQPVKEEVREEVQEEANVRFLTPQSPWRAPETIEVACDYTQDLLADTLHCIDMSQPQPSALLSAEAIPIENKASKRRRSELEDEENLFGSPHPKRSKVSAEGERFDRGVILRRSSRVSVRRSI
ncbi:hypothetical protein FZEAL_2841 [Fusarium zealandicum]|uniref:Uncharacterized protein n=1 Tax=Fusarium zealandicum TaxID=1053134 RepID=A0A8H4XN29_9HYPO|nr:hypothetical protein FZEAL_2841 [Fusarium zealandicum]